MRRLWTGYAAPTPWGDGCGHDGGLGDRRSRPGVTAAADDRGFRDRRAWALA